MWRRLLIAWAYLVALLCAAGTASAASSAPAKPHQGTSEFSAALNVCAFALATVEAHTGNTPVATTGTSDVPDAARGLPQVAPRVILGICFAKGTPVHTSEGLKPIEEVAVGDLVWAWDEATGELSLRRVVRLFETPDQPLVEVTIAHVDGSEETIRATSEHPFWTGEGWIPANQLEPGDRVWLRSGAWSKVAGLTETDNQETVYNFEVDTLHTYFVGAGGTLVHNQSALTRPLAAADIGLSGGGIAALEGSVFNAGTTRIINVANIKAVSPGALVGELRGALPNILNAARAEGVQTLQISGTFANPGLQQFAASQAARFGGTFSSSGGVETLTFILR